MAQSKAAKAQPSSKTPPDAASEDTTKKQQGRTKSKKQGSSAGQKPTQKLTWQQRLWREVRGYAEALVIAFLIVTFIFTTVGVVGSSMRPNLNGGSGQLPEALFSGDRVFIPKYDTWLRRAGLLPEYQRGEIVVVREPANAPSAQVRDRRPFFIKRLIAVEGDRLRIERGQVFVNDVAIDQSFITETGEITPDPVNFPIIKVENGEVTGFRGLAPRTSSFSGDQTVDVNDTYVQLFYGGVLDALAPLPEDVPEGEPFVHEIIIPENQVFVMGDNRESAAGGSEDSRYFGPIRRMTIAGRATALIWPPMRAGSMNWQVLRPPEAFDVLNDN
ncbi:MAG: signal peptidase I [Deinococcota bacterium]